MDTALVVALIATAGSVLAAGVSARSSLRATQAKAAADAAVVRAEAVSSRQQELNEPFVELVRSAFDQSRTGIDVDPERVQAVLGEFLTWSQLYGSDATVRAAHGVMQGSFAEAPGQVALRLMTELILRMRQDVQPGTGTTLSHLLGLRINDFYERGFATEMTLPLRAFCRQHDWTPPWPPELDT